MKKLNWSEEKQVRALAEIMDLQIQVGELFGQLARAREDIDTLEGELQARGERDA